MCRMERETHTNSFTLTNSLMTTLRETDGALEELAFLRIIFLQIVET